MPALACSSGRHAGICRSPARDPGRGDMPAGLLPADSLNHASAREGIPTRFEALRSRFRRATTRSRHQLHTRSSRYELPLLPIVPWKHGCQARS